MENDIVYQQALELFEQEDYEGAVELFIRLYEAGYEREALLGILYDCFVTPNEAEFLKNYEENCEGLDLGGCEELLLDFIPVSDTKYYIFHKKLMCFLGSMDISGEQEAPDGREAHGVLIADIWDLRDMLPYIGMRAWNACYILLDENRSGFLSFFKLPGIKRKYLSSAMVFLDSESMKRFFTENPDYYLPKQIVSGHAPKYREILYGLHRSRLEDKRSERKNVLLSVCIPSYGRGSVCLENVQNILRTEYDAEIEIVVSNNGSTADTEGYEAIKNLPDSRVTYFEFEENQGYGANVCKTLELARGRFIVFTSDEDFMNVEKLHDYMNYLINNADKGIIMSLGIGDSFKEFSHSEYRAGIDTLNQVMNCNYLTGITLNSFWVQSNKVLQRIAQHRENKFVEIYMHIALALLTSEHSGMGISGIRLWHSMRETDDTEEARERILPYMHYDSRMEQMNSALEFLDKVMDLQSDEFVYMITERVQKIYFLCWLAYSERAKAYSKIIDWRVLCTTLHKNNTKLLENYGEFFSENGKLNFGMFLADTFFTNVRENPMERFMTRRELADYKMVGELAAYLFEQGRDISDIDYPKLEREWREFTEKI
ncbi:MAG: glycosyltransferase [Butyrivibrio sp.]|nr:glycosyltransferase [Butyrivibrio sp.]